MLLLETLKSHGFFGLCTEHLIFQDHLLSLSVTKCSISRGSLKMFLVDLLVMVISAT